MLVCLSIALNNNNFCCFYLKVLTNEDNSLILILMSNFKERGVVHLLTLLILIVGTIAGLYLVQQRTNFFPRAVSSPSQPVTFNTGFLLSPSATTIKVGDQTAVKLVLRSDLKTANLFTAKISFNKDLLSIDKIDYSNTVIKSWVEQYYNNTTGEISLVGGIPNPGLKTSSTSEPAPMAVIYFRATKMGNTPVYFTTQSAVYSNIDNKNILTYKGNLTLKITPLVSSCDVNSDGIINLADGTIVHNCWTKPATGVCGPVDLNKDGVIGADDIQKYAYSCPQIFIPPPPSTLTPTPTQPLTPTPTVSSPNSGSGDGNRDGVVNLIDMSVLLSDFNKISNFRAGIDLNRDGVINTFDLSLLRNLLIQKGVIRK